MRKFILGTDWWTDCDDAVALRVLARAHKKGEINILGIGINGCMEHSVASVDAFLSFEGVKNIPLGIDIEATDFGGNPPYQARLATLSEKTNEDAEDAVKLYRRLLSESEDKVEIIEIGYPQVLSALLESGADEISNLSGYELVESKVLKMWVMAGKWDENPGRENNFARNPRSRRAGNILCEKCPVPMTFLGWEVGAEVISGGELEENDILHKVMCDHGSENGRSSWDPMLVLLALVGDEEKAGYYVTKGKAYVDAETGENRFEKNEQGKHCYVSKKMDNDYYKNWINRLIG